jgi:hypothetical protein
VPTLVIRPGGLGPCITQHRQRDLLISLHRQREVVDNRSDPPGENLANHLDVQTCFGRCPSNDDTDERTRSPGAAYTLVRAGDHGSTRPFTEMQSGNVQHRAALTRMTQQRGQHDDQRKPESSRQEHQACGIDEKSLTEWLGFTAYAPAEHVL